MSLPVFGTVRLVRRHRGPRLEQAAPGHPPFHRVQERVAVGKPGTDGEPCPERTARFLSERQDAGRTPCAHGPNLVELRHPGIVESEADKLGDAEPGVAGETQHRPGPGFRSWWRLPES